MASETCWIWSEPGSKIAPISAGRWSAGTQDEATTRVNGVFILPIGIIKRKDRCE